MDRLVPDDSRGVFFRTTKLSEIPDEAYVACTLYIKATLTTVAVYVPISALVGRRTGDVIELPESVTATFAGSPVEVGQVELVYHHNTMDFSDVISSIIEKTPRFRKEATEIFARCAVVFMKSWQRIHVLKLECRDD